MPKRKVLEFLEGNISPFGKWFAKIDSQAAAKVSTALYRLEQGHSSNIKSVGGGVFEYKIDFGPGYRIYFGREGDQIVILLAGGSKKSQNNDIKIAQERWIKYKLRRKA
ncbi:MAG: type II toxin-antitoxin system RelE/ParE family toxin [Nitrospirae bacterium]|nr:type II toxin-antitoxin system RelE/ParE family toxin [Nitrospirota bacterium]